MATETSSERRSRGSCDHLLDLPSSGLLVTFEPDQNEFKVMVGPSYVCTHDTSPPNGQRILSEDRHTMVRRFAGQYKLDREIPSKRSAGGGEHMRELGIKLRKLS
ncbi:hypothetical protein GUITHDRAFT_114409 [Guillardia theta CCMP2712]|uniref:DET1- and DDB1-associated protein 1 domain-containing protein n=1 Tax=Guillardia theta (strain CCMP2712) TaxID=905079 RepID=L1IU69_GUITC|nr:hypothetical protein GUITHDRAFT_114409 [Guillardia theta CCMP2712]EKX39449.1 hypothetical protein GUITHDRAFT_114409 [Guillardia theta CCMP2712]|eukprot:XP_005826429.1 hypothetical protein GUITHDRAFT_114409 [Guillardia theta CCMP2712]